MNTIIEILKKGSIQIEGQLIIGSNYTFLTSIEFEDTSFHAVYKPEKGEIPLWDFPPNTLANRETAAFLLSEAINWGFVPPTIIRSDAPLGLGSLQYFIPHDPQLNYFTFSDEIKDSLRPVVVFDMIINNADRKGSHIIIDQQGQIKLIDHGICFHHDPKLRTVIWDFIGERIPPLIIQDLEQLKEKIESKSTIRKDLEKLLSSEEINALILRIGRI
ncbi:MAG: hypothetical protein Q7J07_04635, partial [Pelolinea sp.]|nr:hypothetical protein [Pelolinea sp.]